jgi:hypothetical protein
LKAFPGKQSRLAAQRQPNCAILWRHIYTGAVEANIETSTGIGCQGEGSHPGHIAGYRQPTRTGIAALQQTVACCGPNA